jgi:hypothetical protein
MKSALDTIGIARVAKKAGFSKQQRNDKEKKGGIQIVQ